jgi:phosphoribosyl 1,2-cyclic phosphodiesterase
MIEIVPMEHKKDIVVGDVTIRPYLIDHTKGFCFVITKQDKNVVYIPCEYHHVIPDPEIKKADIFIVHNLFWENKDISPRKNAPADEDSFEEMLKHADSFGTKKIILTHIEESFQLDHDEMNEKMKKHYPDYDVQAGYDGMKIVL